MKKCIRNFVVILGVIFFVACGNKVESVYQDETCIGVGGLRKSGTDWL